MRPFGKALSKLCPSAKRMDVWPCQSVLHYQCNKHSKRWTRIHVRNIGAGNSAFGFKSEMYCQSRFAKSLRVPYSSLEIAKRKTNRLPMRCWSYFCLSNGRMVVWSYAEHFSIVWSYFCLSFLPPDNEMLVELFGLGIFPIGRSTDGGGSLFDGSSSHWFRVVPHGAAKIHWFLR